MLTLQQKLDAIHNRSTKYELIAQNAEDGRRILIAYTLGQSRHKLLAACRERGEAVVALCCPSGEELLQFGKKSSDGATIGKWAIRYSGRTQREAYIEGELPYVKDAFQPVATARIA